MTGVGDVIWAIKKTARNTASVPLYTLKMLMFLIDVLPTRIATPLRLWVSKLLSWRLQEQLRKEAFIHHVCPKQVLPSGLSTLRLPFRPPHGRIMNQAINKEGHMDKPRWALLLPFTSHGTKSESEMWARLEKNMMRLVESIPVSHRSRTRAYIGIDGRDPALDNDEARRKLRHLLGKLDGVDFGEPLVPAYKGALCWIWAELSRRAKADSADLFILLGDDVEMHTNDWQVDVELRFKEIAYERHLPYGCAVVALRDKSFPVFPTFPVFHKWHLDVFGDGELFPREFRNQHGDPFLWELYRRWGASRFAQEATLSNSIGGADDARYMKHGNFDWAGEILTHAINRLEAVLLPIVGEKRIPCIDVVIPTYRCDLSMLKSLTSLVCNNRQVSLHTIVICDNPKSANLDDVRGLVSYTPDQTVRVDFVPFNMGAAAARNLGLDQSFGDHCVLLDDDVVPDHGLMEAYLAAIDRFPHAPIYVGVTTLPEPTTFVQRSIIASGICYFYGVATKHINPPWGVTANICVRSRGNKTRFSLRYPRTGGGEDVDYCIRVSGSRGLLVSVPGAIVQHPFWSDPSRQVRGWASGDVLCLDALPHAVFYTLPNWIEMVFICAVIALWAWYTVTGTNTNNGITESESELVSVPVSVLAQLGSPVDWLQRALLVLAVEVAMLLPRYLAAAHGNPFVALFAASFPLQQDVVRLLSKLQRWKFSVFCAHFDWMNAQGHHPLEMQRTQNTKTLALALTCAAVEDICRREAIILLTALYST